MKMTFILASLLCSSLTFASLDQYTSGYKWISHEKTVKAKVKAKKRGRRSISSKVEVDDSRLSKEFKSFRKTYLSIKDPIELEKQLRHIDKNYDSYPDDLKLVAAILTPMLEMKSFAYRMYPLLKREKVTHSVLLTRVYRFASFMSVNLPTDQWDAGFRFMSEPFEYEMTNNRFHKTSDLQEFVTNKIYPALAKAAERVQALDFSTNNMTWDHKLLYGTASFQDEFKRYRLIGESERLLLLANLHYGLSWSARFSAYNVSGTLSLVKDMGSLYGIDSMFGFSKVDGVTAKKIVAKINKRKYKKLFTILDGGKEKMQLSFKHLREAARVSVVAWEEMKERRNGEANESALIRSEMFESFIGRIDRGAETFVDIVNGPTIVRSDITGEVITVDLPKFLMNPPKDLKSLLPTSFTSADDMKSKKIANKSGKMKSVKFRNYHYGKATSWELKSYNTLLPEVKNGDDISTAARILNQSPGAAPVALIINPFMMYNR
ncbi:hypothetical protein A9Q84_19690 [Halobacteriovorax marinus]|uniref:Uncharacterized protein n=1 Tax=Halobacteriovorax marinus TaxID=97084 RepID=A0A1Y5F8G3_9BACT|nr:hypothetical protein A9Q84_19690 [Halobacteriovorax marinus]